MSVFAHVVSLNLPPEPAATQALEYVLRDADALRKSVGMLAPIDVSFEARGVESEKAHGDGRPDLVVYDVAGNSRVFVENKLWAGLTPAQPVTYLDHLPEDDEFSVLLFLVPEKRADSVWAELKRRCAEAGLSVAEEGRAGVLLAGKLSGNRIMAVADWRRVLDGLTAVHSVRSDVQQLRALTERMDVEAFLPIRAVELTGLRPSHFYRAAGRYVAMHGRLGLWLGVDLDLWREAGGRMVRRCGDLARPREDVRGRRPCAGGRGGRRATVGRGQRPRRGPRIWELAARRAASFDVWPELLKRGHRGTRLGADSVRIEVRRTDLVCIEALRAGWALPGTGAVPDAAGAQSCGATPRTRLRRQSVARSASCGTTGGFAGLRIGISEGAMCG